MKTYKISKMDVSTSEREKLQLIGIDEEVEIIIDIDQKSNHLTYIYVDGVAFCLRKEIMKRITLEEV